MERSAAISRRPDCLCVDFPKRNEDTASSLERFQEALELLAAVAHVDAAAWRYLLTEKCEVLSACDDELFDGVSGLPYKFVVELKLLGESGKFPWAVEVLERCLCRLDERSTRAAYQDAVNRIAALQGDNPSMQHDLEIPVCVLIYSYDSDDAVENLSALWERIQEIEASQAHYTGSMECSCRRGQLGLCCTLVLRTVEVAIEEASNSSEATRIVQEMASFSDRVKLSRLTLFSHDLDSNPQADILERAKLLKSAICGGKCSRIGGQPRDRAQIGAPELPSATWGHTSIDDVGVEEVSINRDDCSDMIESLCSALAVTQSTHSVNFSLLQDHLDDEERARQWQWMAFVFFSRQSRTRSSLRRVIITGDLCLTVEDAEAVADILSADNPEEQLVGYPPRTFPRDPQGSTQFHVQEHALVKTDSIHGRVVEFPMWADVCGVSLLNDDGESEWVEVLVPGLGACSTLRENVSPCEPNEMDVATTQISLTLEVSGWSDFEGMQRFLEVIQPALQHLALISVGSEVAQDISWILEASPTLSRLTISGRTVETAAFIRAYERTAPQLESLCCIFDDVRLLVRALSNKDSVLTRQLRYLRLRVTDSMVTQDENWVSALEDMLRLNRSLEYLTVYTSIDAFDGTRRSHVMDLPHATASGLASVRAHHLEKLPVVGTKFPMECKVAFLSVFTRAEAGDPLKRQKRPTLTLPRTLAELNRHVTTIIFGFAATCAVRKVFVV